MRFGLYIVLVFFVGWVWANPVGYTSMEKKFSALQTGGADGKAALGALMKCSPELRRPISLLALVERACPTNSLGVSRGSAVDCGIQLIGGWKLREGVPFLLNHIDLRYSDFNYGLRRERETRMTDDYFPCVQALRVVGADATGSIIDYVVQQGFSEKGKLAVSALMLIHGKDDAVQRLQAFLSEQEKVQLRALLVFAESWERSWILESPK